MENKPEWLTYLSKAKVKTGPRIDERDENSTTIASLRKNWNLLSKSEDGELYQTPRGKYLLEKNKDGSTKRLKLVDE